MFSAKRVAAYLAIRLVPYLAVYAGLYLFRSAWVALVGYHIGIVVVFAFTGQWRQVRRIRVENWPWVAFCSALSLLAGWLLYASWAGIGIAVNLPESLLGLGLTAQNWLWFIAYFSLVNPWLEEMYWRGWLGSEKRFPILDDLWFASYHLLILIPFVPLVWLLLAWGVLISAAWGWRQVVRLTGSLFAPSMAHLLADLSILLAIYSRIR